MLWLINSINTNTRKRRKYQHFPHLPQGRPLLNLPSQVTCCRKVLNFFTSILEICQESVWGSLNQPSGQPVHKTFLEPPLNLAWVFPSERDRLNKISKSNIDDLLPMVEQSFHICLFYREWGKFYKYAFLGGYALNLHMVPRPVRSPEFHSPVRLVGWLYE